MGEESVTAFILNLGRNLMEGSGQLHLPFAIVDRWTGNWWTPQPIRTFWKREKSFPLPWSRSRIARSPAHSRVSYDGAFWLRYPTVRSLNEIQYSVKSRQHNFAFVMWQEATCLGLSRLSIKNWLKAITWCTETETCSFLLHDKRIGDCGSTVVKVLCYKSEGRWFDSRWCHWNFSLT